MARVDISLLKSLEPGQQIRGPEPFGCINSGFAVSIRCWRDFDGNPFYLVGVDLDVSDRAIASASAAALQWHGKRSYSGSTTRQTVRIFRSFSSARNAYKKQCDTVIREAVKQAQALADAKRRAADGDIEAALSLLDF